MKVSSVRKWDDKLIGDLVNAMKLPALILRIIHFLTICVDVNSLIHCVNVVCCMCGGCRYQCNWRRLIVLCKIYYT